MGSVLELTKQDIRLWALLSYHAPRVVTKKTIYEFLYGAPYTLSNYTDHYIRVRIKILRRKVAGIKIVYASGYYLDHEI